MAVARCVFPTPLEPIKIMFVFVSMNRIKCPLKVTLKPVPSSSISTYLPMYLGGTEKR